MNAGTRLATLPLALTPLVAAPALAEDANGWTGSAEFGAAMTTGNSETSSLNGKLRIGHEAGRWNNQFRLEAFRSTEDGDETANRVLAEHETDFALSERDYLFGVLRGTRDEFSGYDYQASAAAGYGRKLWIGERGHWDAEMGPGVRIAEPRDGERDTNAILRANTSFAYAVSDTARFEQDVTVLAGSDNTEIESVTGLAASITDTLAMKLSYTVAHNTDVPADTEKTDTYTSINLVYDFQ
jgi:putative salt-induced outer membrane protein